MTRAIRLTTTLSTSGSHVPPATCHAREMRAASRPTTPSGAEGADSVTASQSRRARASKRRRRSVLARSTRGVMSRRRYTGPGARRGRLIRLSLSQTQAPHPRALHRLAGPRAGANPGLHRPGLTLDLARPSAPPPPTTTSRLPPRRAQTPGVWAIAHRAPASLSSSSARQRGGRELASPACGLPGSLGDDLPTLPPRRPSHDNV